ncbi:MAG: MarR family transcriptional regulator [Pseudomonadota bacterium]
MLALPEKANEMFCFAVYGATHAINRAYAPLLKPWGLTYPQYITLTLLWEHDGQGVGEIAGQLGMESSTLTPLLKRLEKLGHVERRRGDEDERQVFVHLTKSGRSLQKAAQHITKCLVESTGLEPRILEGIVEQLTQLRTNLEEQRSTLAGKAHEKA